MHLYLSIYIYLYIYIYIHIHGVIDNYDTRTVCSKFNSNPWRKTKYFSNVLISTILFCLSPRIAFQLDVQPQWVVIIFVSVDLIRSFIWSKILVWICFDKTLFFLHFGFRFCLFTTIYFDISISVCASIYENRSFFIKWLFVLSLRLSIYWLPWLLKIFYRG